MADLTPIKVKIGLQTAAGKSQHAYPAFETLACVQAAGCDWAIYMDQNGSGWLYDGTCGHSDHAADSPCGTWLGVALVPDEFATQAVAAFASQVEIINEAAFQAFYEGKVTSSQPSQNYNTEMLQAIAAKKALDITLSAEDNAALDPANDSPGITVNKTKTWAGLKAAKAYTIRTDLRS